MVYEFQENWEAELQERLLDPTIWDEVNTVVRSNDQIFHAPYETPTATSTGTRGTAVTPSTVSQTDETVTINDFDYVQEFADFADLGQSKFANTKNRKLQQLATVLEKMDNSLLAAHASWTNLGTGDIGGGGSSNDAITVTSTNVPKIVDGVVQKILDAKGLKLQQKNGAFIIWRASDYSAVAQAAKNLGFMEADKNIKEGAQYGMYWGGVYHYFSNEHEAAAASVQHLFAGVRKANYCYIVEETFGKLFIIDHPANGDGNLQGLGFETRIDREYMAWNNFVPVLYDINVVA